MAGKISEYTTEQTTLQATDRFDVSTGIGGTPTSEYLSWASLQTQLSSAGFASSGDNVSIFANDAGYITSVPAGQGGIYGGSGSLIGVTTVDLATFDLNIESDNSLSYLKYENNGKLTLQTDIDVLNTLTLGTGSGATAISGIEFNNTNAAPSKIYDRGSGTHDNGLTFQSRNNVFEFIDNTNSVAGSEIELGVLKVLSIEGLAATTRLKIYGASAPNGDNDGIEFLTADASNVMLQRFSLEADATNSKAIFSNISNFNINATGTALLNVGGDTIVNGNLTVNNSSALVAFTGNGGNLRIGGSTINALGGGIVTTQSTNSSGGGGFVAGISGVGRVAMWQNGATSSDFGTLTGTTTDLRVNIAGVLSGRFKVGGQFRWGDNESTSASSEKMELGGRFTFRDTTIPTATTATCKIYAKDVAGTSKLFVMDGAGVETQLN